MHEQRGEINVYPAYQFHTDSQIYVFFFAMEHQRLVQKKTFVKDIYKFYHDLHFKMIG